MAGVFGLISRRGIVVRLLCLVFSPLPQVFPIAQRVFLRLRNSFYFFSFLLRLALVFFCLLVFAGGWGGIGMLIVVCMA